MPLPAMQFPIIGSDHANLLMQNLLQGQQAGMNFQSQPYDLQAKELANALAEIQNRYIPQEFEANIGHAKAQTGLTNEQAKWFGPSAQSTINAQGALAGLHGAQTRGINIENQYLPQKLIQAILGQQATNRNVNAEAGGREIENEWGPQRQAANIGLTTSQTEQNRENTNWIGALNRALIELQGAQTEGQNLTNKTIIPESTANIQHTLAETEGQLATNQTIIPLAEATIQHTHALTDEVRETIKTINPKALAEIGALVASTQGQQIENSWKDQGIRLDMAQKKQVIRKLKAEADFYGPKASAEIKQLLATVEQIDAEREGTEIKNEYIRPNQEANIEAVKAGTEQAKVETQGKAIGNEYIRPREEANIVATNAATEQTRSQTAKESFFNAHPELRNEDIMKYEYFNQPGMQSGQNETEIQNNPSGRSQKELGYNFSFPEVSPEEQARNIAKYGKPYNPKQQKQADLAAKDLEVHAKAWDKKAEEINKGTKTADEMKTIVEQFSNAYDKSRNTGPGLTGGSIDPDSWSGAWRASLLNRNFTAEKEADQISKDLVGKSFGMFKSRVSNMDLKYLESVKPSRLWTPEQKNQYLAKITAADDRTHDYSSFMDAMRDEGFTAEKADKRWNDYVSQNHVFDSATDSINFENIGKDSWMPYVKDFHYSKEAQGGATIKWSEGKSGQLIGEPVGKKSTRGSK